GVTVFVMMEFTGLSYFEIIIAALTPALAYFIIVYIRIHIYSVKKGISGLPSEEVPKFASVMRGGFHLLIPLIVLIVLLGLRYTPLYAASYSVISLIVVLLIVKMISKLSIINFSYKTDINLSLIIESFVLGAKRTAPVSVICACAGIIASVMSMTGLGLQVSSIIRL